MRGPSRANDYSLAKKMTLSSPSGKSLRLQPVAAAVGDQDDRAGRILLDLLAQAIDVGFQGVRGDPGIVAPDLVQQDIAGDRPVAGAEQVFQDRGFLVGQADLFLAALLRQHLGGGVELVRTDGHYRIFAALMLAQMGAQASQQDIDAERLGDVVVGARFEAEDGVGVGVGGGQHDDRRAHALAAHQLAQLAAVHVGQADIEQDGVVMGELGPLQPLGGRADLDGGETVIEVELLGEHSPQRLVVVDQQNFLAAIVYRHACCYLPNAPRYLIWYEAAAKVV